MTDKEYYSDKTMITNTMLGWLMVSAAYYKKMMDLMDVVSD